MAKILRRHNSHVPVLVKPSPEGGVGTELKTILARVGITSTPNCKCNARAKEMDRRGIEWCEGHIPTIVEWLREEASVRRLPFSSLAASLLVRRAIKKAKYKHEANQTD